jgi:hypothetical protein
MIRTGNEFIDMAIPTLGIILMLIVLIKDIKDGDKK